MANHCWRMASGGLWTMGARRLGYLAPGSLLLHFIIRNQKGILRGDQMWHGLLPHIRFCYLMVISRHRALYQPALWCLLLSAVELLMGPACHIQARLRLLIVLVIVIWIVIEQNSSPLCSMKVHGSLSINTISYAELFGAWIGRFNVQCDGCVDR